MKKVFLFFCCFVLHNLTLAQAPKTWAASDILHEMKKLEVFGSVLYIAAHPDDENTRLLAYLANERKLRTGYLSLTRGDGGQNLIGDEQGIDLGLIRTQELLAARRIDGAQQFFTRAYDFGYSKSPEETLEKWGHDKILSDVVWIIRKFRPDVIITRFPATGEGGHGHHTASAILAGEAFDAAADTTKFSEQFSYGVTTWKARRLLWNTFNFGGNSLQRDDQLRVDVGMYNPLLGKSYGEIAAQSRSQHKSQGFGVAAQRGESFEYFATIKGDKPLRDIMEGVNISSQRLGLSAAQQKKYDELIGQLISGFNPFAPQHSLPLLQQIDELVLLKNEPLSKRVSELIAQCAGFFMEATVVNQLNATGDSIRFNTSFNNRLGLPLEIAQVSAYGRTISFPNLSANVTNSITSNAFITELTPPTQPYWLEYPPADGSFDVRRQTEIGMPQNMPAMAQFQVQWGGKMYNFERPVMYKFTDPVKGEIYEPTAIVQPVFVNVSPSLLIIPNKQKTDKKIQFTLQANEDITGSMRFSARFPDKTDLIFDSTRKFAKGEKIFINYMLHTDAFAANSKTHVGGMFEAKSLPEQQYFSLGKISYDHIPDIYRGYYDATTVVKMDLEIAGKRIGYIPGAGDKVPQALEQMGYQVTVLSANDISAGTLKNFDAVVTGVRAYNTNAWLPAVRNVLMEYVKNGGVLLVQYNTNNNISSLREGIGPYPFTVTRNRITDENAAVKMLKLAHPVLNYPNKITSADFEGWVQERSIYHAQTTDNRYTKIFSMHDAGEADDDGSLIIADYGKGRFIYTGIVFFRELPAGVPGAYRLIANLLAPPQ